MIEIVGALIQKDNKFLIAQRKVGDAGDKWEFPGGKIEFGETDVDAIKREVKEELDIEVDVLKYLGSNFYTYPTRTIHMNLYHCKYLSGNIGLSDHKDFKWIDLNQLHNFELCPLDCMFVKKLIKQNL